MQHRVIRVMTALDGKACISDEGLYLLPDGIRIVIDAGDTLDLEEPAQAVDLVQTKRELPSLCECPLLADLDRWPKTHQQDGLVHGPAIRYEALVLDASPDIGNWALDSEEVSPAVCAQTREGDADSRQRVGPLLRRVGLIILKRSFAEADADVAQLVERVPLV